MSTKYNRKQKKPPTYKTICAKCETLVGPRDIACPQCGSQSVKIVPPVDLRRAFTVDNRRNGPI